MQDDQPDPPTGTAGSQRQGSPLVLDFPAKGFAGAGCGLLIFGIVFGGAGMCGLVQTLAAGFSPPAEGRPPQSIWDTLLALAGLCPFIASGVGILVGCLDAVQRATTVTLTDDTLAYRRRTGSS